MSKLLVLAHGIGDAPKDFYKDWQDVIAENHDLTGVTVRGLWWEDVLQKVEDKYDLVSGPFAEIVKMCGFDALEKFSTNDQWKTFKDYMMDVLVYVGLPDMWLYIQNTCTQKLADLQQSTKTGFTPSQTILIGHSLGAAMLPQLAWRDCIDTGVMAYGGMILLASPLGFESPYPKLCQDFLQRMGHPGDDRNSVLTGFAAAWQAVGSHRLRFVSNLDDIVCSDVKFQLPTGLADLIPIQQGFSPSEIFLLNQVNPDSYKTVEFGSPDPSKIADNHDALTYLKQDAFNEALGALLA